MLKRSKTTDQSATADEEVLNRKRAIRKRSKIPGVMITQFVTDIPEGKSTPDFIRNPIPVTIQEGKLAVFKAIVKGDPKPEVTWRSAKNDTLDKNKFQSKYDESSGECILEIPKVSGEDADTYKCFAVNTYGKAVCTATLHVIEVGFKKEKAMEQLDIESTDPAEFRKMLRKSKVGEKLETKKEDWEIDERFWEVIMSADRKDYERICAEFGVKDLRLILKKLEERKQEREEEQSKYVDYLSNLRHVDVRGDGFASFEFEIELKDPTCRILLYKDGVMVPYNEDSEMKHSLKMVGKKLVFSIRDIMPEDAGLYQVDVEEVNVFTTDLRIPTVDFVVKIEEVNAREREDALFECVLSHPLPRIKWVGKNSILEDGEKYSITVSDDKLIHRLLVKDCMQLDKGIYAAVAGIKSCSAWLVVEADTDRAQAGKKTARKTTRAGGAGVDLEKVAQEQQNLIQKERENIEAAIQVKKETKQVIDEELSTRDGGDGESMVDNRLSKTSKTGGDMDKARKNNAKSKKVGGKEDAKVKNSGRDGDGSKSKGSGGVTTEEAVQMINNNKNKKHTRTGQVIPVDVTGSSGNDDVDPNAQAGDGDHSECNGYTGALVPNTIIDYLDGTEDLSGSAKHSRRAKQGSELQDAVTDPNEQSDSDGNEESAGPAQHSRHTKQGQRNQHGTTDPNELSGSDDGKVDSSRSAKHSKRTKQGQRKQGEAIDPNELSGSDWNGDPAGSAKHLRCTKQGQQNQVTDPNELSGSDDGNGESAGSAKHSRPTKQGQQIQGEVIAFGHNTDPNEQSDFDGNEDSAGSAERSKQGQQKQCGAIGESTDPNVQSEYDETEDSTGSAVRTRQGPLVHDTVIDPGVQFISGLSDVNAIIGEPAEMICKLNSGNCEGAWFRDGNKLSAGDDFIITKDGATHKLVISSCKEEHSGKYRFEADGRKTEAMINVKDPPRFNSDDLSAFTKPVIVKVGKNAIFKLPFVGLEPMKIQWCREEEELLDDNNIKIEKSTCHSRLLLSKCQRKDTGEIKIKIKNEHGTAEALSQLIVLDKPSPPLGPAEIEESSAVCINFKWRPPKDDGGSPVINYILERQQVGRNTWKKLGEIPGVPTYRDTDVDHGRKYCYRIRARTAEGISEMMETDDIQAGTLAFPGPPAPPKVVSAFNDCVNLSWAPSANTGGSCIFGYNLEKRKKGSNLWSAVNPTNEPIKEKIYAVKDVVAGMEYEFRVAAINFSGLGEFSNPSEFVFARDPKKPPGKVIDLKVTDTSYTHLSLAWTKPEEIPGVQDEAKGYYIEIRQAESIEWSRCNVTHFILTSYSVKGLRSMGMYWVRVIATNDGGDSDHQELDNYVLAMPPPVRPRFTDRKMKNFMVVRAGNSVRLTVNFEASPWPEVIWMKDNVPVTKRITISNSDGSSQMLIPSSERSDSGVYSILVKNLVGQETFSTEVRVTDDPKPPGPVELEENVPATVTVIWQPSPDEKRDDHLHYTVSKLDSTKRTWSIVADRLFNNKFTVCNIMHGREYHFRVYAKNDMGMSAPSESPTWGTQKKKEKFVVNVPTKKDCDLQSAPAFIVPLKLHTAPKGYECYMSCAVKGNPKPRITWYRNNISLNTNTNYYISNICGVCSMLILRVGLKDTGEYTISAENALGRAECSTNLSVRE